MYQTIQRELAMVRLDKISTHCDLDDCFGKNDETPGMIGKVFKERSEDTVNRLIVERNRMRLMPAFPMPTTLANTQTRELLDRLYPHSAQRERERLETAEWLQAATGLNVFVFDMSEKRCPDSLNLFYVGDFLNCVEDAISLNRRIKTSVLLGDGQGTLDIVRKLRNIPDYSHHFPNVPPGPGRGRRKEEAKPVFVPGGALQPTGS